MSAERDWSRAPIYSARDLYAAEADAFARGREGAYLAGFQDGRAGRDADHRAQAAAFAAVARRIFGDSVPMTELVRRRAEASGHPEVYAASIAAADAQAARLRLDPTATTERTAA